MKVFLFGATSPTGRLVLERLLSDGHSVVALARNPDALGDVSHPHLQIVRGDVFRADTYEQHFRDAEVIVSILGTGKSNKPTTVYSAGGTAILHAMRNAGVKKLITITSGGVQKDDPVIQKSFFYKYVGLWYLRHIYRDMAAWEEVLDRANDIDWICVRPTYLRNGPFTGVYRVANRYAPPGGWKISRADLADFITKQVESDEFVHQKPVVAY